MKKTFFTGAVAAALIIGACAFLTSPAEAASAKAKFAAMKKAMGQNLHLQISTDGGQPKAVVYINGQLVDVKNGVPFTYQDGNNSVTVTTAMSKADLDKLPPEQRAMMEKALEQAIAAAHGGKGVFTNVTQNVVVDGRTLSPEEAQAMLKKLGSKINITPTPDGKGIDIDLGFNFDEGSYSAMKFGANQNTLLLTPKKGPNTRYSLVLDPRTNLPSTVTLQKVKAGKWSDVKVSRFRYSVPLK